MLVRWNDEDWVLSDHGYIVLRNNKDVGRALDELSADDIMSIIIESIKYAVEHPDEEEPK
jgi:hypothetical protein